ncbi:MAG: hypothetical protein STHCBS139747_002193 [Sporothrix thermara]
MDDEQPILRSFLDSLDAMNQRLYVFENVLAVTAGPALPSITQQAQQQQTKQTCQSIAVGHSQALPQPRPSPAGASSNHRPLPLSAISTPPLHSPSSRLKIEDDSYNETLGIDSNDSRFSTTQQGSDGGRPCKYDALKDNNNDNNDDDDDDDDNTNGEDGDDDDDVVKGEGASDSLPKELQPTGVSHSRLEALPEGFVVSGRATLQEELDSWTIPRGYSMRINGTRSHGRRQKIRMVCFRGGRSRLRPKEEEAKRERERERLVLFPDLPPRRRKPTTDRISKKCECPYRFELVEICPGADRYAVHYTNDDHTQHNHAAADLMLDPRARKLPRALKAEVDQWLRDASTLGGNGKSSDASNTGWTIAKIQAELQRRGYGHVLDFDLRNRKRALLHKDRIAQQKKDEDSGSSGRDGAAAAGAGAESSAGGDTPTAVT